MRGVQCMPAAGACVIRARAMVDMVDMVDMGDQDLVLFFLLECLLARGSLKLLLVVSCRPLARGGFPGAEPRKPPACLVSYSPLTSPRSPSSTRARTSEESGRRPRRLLNRSPRPPRRGTAAAPRPCSPPGSWERPTRRGPARSCPKRGRASPGLRKLTTCASRRARRRPRAVWATRCP